MELQSETKEFVHACVLAEIRVDFVQGAFVSGEGVGALSKLSVLQYVVVVGTACKQYIVGLVVVVDSRGSSPS